MYLLPPRKKQTERSVIAKSCRLYTRHRADTAPN